MACYHSLEMSRRLALGLTLFLSPLAACDDSDVPGDAAVGADVAVGVDRPAPTPDTGPRDLGPDGAVTDALPGDLPSPDASDAGAHDATSRDAEPVDAGGCPSPAPSCQGVCALAPARCDDDQWVCDQGPGHEAIETTCDGFDNDCDGERDEGCPSCVVQEPELRNHLSSIADIDFDAACTGYLTSLVSGPDYTWVVPSSGAGRQYFGQANQNMGYALVDPDPRTQRVVVTYSCCESCNCQAQNGLTLLYTCTATMSGCGCSGQSNCPGFLDAPFLGAGYEDAPVAWGTISTPSGLAAGPGGAYFVGNWRPSNCGSPSACVSCGPTDQSFCQASDTPCCDDRAAGRLAQFTLPGAGLEPSFRVVAVFEDETIVGLASGRAGELMVGTSSASGGDLHRYDPSQGIATRVRRFGGTVASVTQDRRSGDWYVEEVGTSSSTLHRLSEDGAPRTLPIGLPRHPPGRGALQVGPDDRLYRIQIGVDGPSGLEVWTLP